MLRLICLVALVLGCFMVASAQTDLEEHVTLANQEFVNRFATGNPDSVAALYAAQGRLLPPHSKALVGSSSIQNYWANFFKTSAAKSIAINSQTLNWISRPDLAFEIGTFRFFNSHGSILDVGKHIVVWTLSGNVPRRLVHAYNLNTLVSSLEQAPVVSGASGNSSVGAADQLLLDLTSRNIEFMRSWANGDLVQLGNIFDASAVIQPHGAPSVSGADQVQMWFREVMGSGVRSFLLSIDQVGLTNRLDFAYEVGRTELKASDGRILESGTYTSIWRRHNSRWFRVAFLLNPQA